MLSSVDRVVQRAGQAVVILALVAMLALLALGVVVRTFPVIPLAGYDEIVELLMAWMTFLGAALLWGEGSLYRVDVLTNRLGPRAGRTAAGQAACRKADGLGDGGTSSVAGGSHVA